MSETESGNDVTCIEEGTVGIESVSLRDADLQPESRANEDAILSRDEAVSRDVEPRDTQPEGVGARPKTTKILQRKNTPAVLPKVDSLYSSLLRSSLIWSIVHCPLHHSVCDNGLSHVLTVIFRLNLE